MKNMILAVTLTAVSLTTYAGTKIDQVLDVSKTADVSIHDQHGNIKVKAWDKGKVKVSGELSRRARDFTFESHGNTVTFDVIYDDKWDWNRKSANEDNSNLVFYVPRGSELQVNSITGDISVTGVEAGANIETVNGAITAEKLKDRVRLQSVNGNISAANNQGKIDIETVNGAVSDKGSSGTLRLRTVQGNVTCKSTYLDVAVEIVNGNLLLDLDKIDELVVESVNGRVDVALDLNRKGDVSVSGVNGTINLDFNKAVDAEFEIDTAVGGSITNKLTDDQAEKQKFLPGSSLGFSTGDGSGDVEVTTVNGNVKVGYR